MDWTLTDAEILAHLLEPVTKPTGRLVTFGEIARDVGDEAYAVIVRVFQVAQQADPGLVPAFHALSTVGMMLDTPSRLAMIDQLATGGYGPGGLQPWPEDWVTKIKAMGVTTGPRWQVELAMTEAPSLESIAAARKAYEDRQAAESLKPWYVARDAVVREGLHNATLTTQSQIVQVFEAD